jgi:TonB family protein
MSKSLVGWKFDLPLDDAMHAARSIAVPKKEVEKGGSDPKCDFCPRPDFSETARKPENNEAVIYVWVLVGADGRAPDAVVMSSTFPKFDAEVLRTVKTWKFKPARNSKGENVAQHVQVIVTYERF